MRTYEECALETYARVEDVSKIVTYAEQSDWERASPKETEGMAL